MKTWKINSKKEFESCVRCSVSEILSWDEEIEQYYKDRIDIPKKNGVRHIYVVKKNNQLYKVQKYFKKYFLDNIYLSDRAYGFVKEQSYLSYLQEHRCSTGHNHYMRIDIKDFFGSISGKHIDTAFDFYIECEEKKEILDAIKKISLYNNELVQGTPVAPSISNIVFRTLDIRIEKYCNKRHVTYTRYADDLLFSCQEDRILDKRFVKAIDSILNSQNFRINYQKLKQADCSLSLNGFVINKDVCLSRKKLKPIGALLFYLERTIFENRKQWYDGLNLEMKRFGIDEISNKEQLINKLAGYRSFLISVVRGCNSNGFYDRCEKMISRMEKQLRILDQAK